MVKILAFQKSVGPSDVGGDGAIPGTGWMIGSEANSAQCPHWALN
jgi:hypothetical protein